MYRSWFLPILAALLSSLAAPVLGGPARHVREIPALDALVRQTQEAIERHEFAAADALLGQARAFAHERGADGRLAELELQAVDALVEIERRHEQRGFELSTAAYDAIEREFGAPVALRSAAALPLATTFLLQENFSRGLAHLDAAEQAMRAAWGERADEIADAEYLRGGFRFYAGEFAAARESYLRAYDRMRRANAEPTLSGTISRAQAALMKVRLGEPAAAIEELRPLLDQLPADPKPRARARAIVLRNLNQALHGVGRPQEAVHTAEEAWTALRDSLGEDDAETLEFLSALATNLGDISRHADALALQQMLLPKFSASYGAVSDLVILTLNNMAFNLAALGEDQEAVQRYREALELSKQLYGAEHPETTYATQQFAVALMRTGAGAEALPLLEAVDARNADAAPPLRAKARSDLYLARALADDAAADRARLVAHVHELARQFGVAAPITVQTATRAGELLLKQGVASNARVMHEIALQGIEQQLAGRQWLPTNRRAFLSRYINLYRSAATLYAQIPADCARALQVAESARGHGLLEAVSRQRALESSDVPAGERSRLAALVATRERLESEAALAPPGTTERARRAAAASAAAIELAQLEETLAGQHPAFARLRAALQFDLQASRRTLARDEAFVEYVVAPGETLAIVVSQAAPPVCIGLGPSAPVLKSARAFRRAIEADPREAAAAARVPRTAMELSQQLLAPLWLHVARFARLVFSPDGPLAGVPLELLPVPGSERPLAGKREVTYAQSLAVLAAIRTRLAAPKESWKRDLLAFGGPSYGAEEAATGLAALVTRSGAATSASGLANRVRSASDALEPAAAFRALGLEWQPLPGAEREARTVAGLFGKSVAVTGAEATEERLQQLSASGELSEFRYLLFATHAYLSTDIPSLSAVVLSLPGTPQADGYVTAAEWPGYHLRSQLVVLSGCETGLGAEGAGDGVLGLPYALFVAGNRNTVVSLWKIADEATTAFMVRLFGHLRAGEPQGTALARTKRDFMRDPRFGAARHWAAFVLYGG